MAKLTTEIFIERAKLVHGDKYDYSKVEYIDYKTKICIVCPIHGEFWQNPGKHLQGQGCYYCGKERTKKSHSSNTNEFIIKSNKIYNNFYDYSLVSYKKSYDKVCIVCPIHGEFLQTPHNHLRGYGCPICNVKSVKTFTTESWVKEANKLRGDLYDYSKVEYIDSKTKVCIICKEHGEFWQLPCSHLKDGHGCPKCAKNQCHSNEYFIEKSNKIFNNFFNYDKVNYKTLKIKVCITCPIHGDFWQIPSVHLKGHGCPKCSGFNKTNAEFKDKSNLIHKNKYDYSKAEYVNAKTKVCIICKEHGEFWQTPSKHINGCGCPMCNESHLENHIRNCLIDNDIDFESQKRFEWVGKQSFDFYLPRYNLAIECQGEQHFKPIDFFGGVKTYAKINKRDIKKYKLCKKYNVKLLYFTDLKEYDMFLNEKLIKNEKELINKIKENE